MPGVCWAVREGKDLQEKGAMTVSTKGNKAVVKRWNEEILNGRQFDAFDQLLHRDYVDRSGSEGSWAPTVQGLEQAKRDIGEVFQRMPDLQMVIEDLIGEGDLVAVRGVFTSEGKPVTNIIGFYRLSDGKIVENWHCSRQLDQ
jgi:predicted SnoaL-like aldol condensation-catalyzing enzyme